MAVLDQLLKRAKEKVAAMTKAEVDEMCRQQAESYARNFRCEHGDPDFETCPKCRGWA